MRYGVKLQAGIVAAILLLLPAVVWAHNGGFPRLNGIESGPYRLYAWTLPNPWYTDEDLHISVAVTQADAATNVGTGPSPEVLVADATVFAQFVPPPESAIEAFTRPLTPTESLGGIYYESDLKLSVDGDWHINIAAESALGKSTGSFVVTVMPDRQMNWLLIGSAGVLFFLLLVVAAVIGRKRPAKR